MNTHFYSNSHTAHGLRLNNSCIVNTLTCMETMYVCVCIANSAKEVEAKQNFPCQVEKKKKKKKKYLKDALHLRHANAKEII